MIEALVSVSLLALLTVVMAATFVAALRTTSETDKRLALSEDAHMSSAFISRDIQSLSGDFSVSDVSPCGGANPAVMSFSRFLDSPTASDATLTNTVSYVIEPNDEGRRLVRLSCGTGAVAPIVVVDYLADTDPTIACPPQPGCTAKPATVEISMTDCARKPDNTCDPEFPNFVYRIRANSRTT